VNSSVLCLHHPIPLLVHLEAKKSKVFTTRLLLRSLIEPEVIFQMVGTDPGFICLSVPLHGLNR